ncbi:DNA polymerase epsilon subunit 4 [Uranotaenia lowii]|uniref:DNA polymerase epsilon subunit 4 n=1 Tax=Uranotaenia lowii TaxID=190385 RepID=UPI00247AAFB7|nr:DNA polymerase epsilon subunit 4 [Uranotaenia lowii]
MMASTSEETNAVKNPETSTFQESEEIDFGSEPFPEIPETVAEVLLETKLATVEKEAEPIEEEQEDDDQLLLEEAVLNEDDQEQDTPSAETDKPSTSRKEPAEPRLVQFPISRVKQIMRMDPNVNIVSAEALFLMTRAAELFLQTMSKEAFTHTTTSKKKTIAKRDVDLAIDSVDTLAFLEGMMNV